MVKERTITVVGSVNIDLVVEMETLPRAGETILGNRFRVAPGGKGANQAVAAARLGARTFFVGCVGNDDHGRMARRNLRVHGVDVDGLRIVDDHTGVALIMVDGEGRNMIGVAPGANLHVRANGQAGAAIDRDIVLTQLETPFSPIEGARFVILNPAPAKPVDLHGVDVVIPNEIEAEQLTGSSDPSEAARALEAMGARRAIITLGADGVWDGEHRPGFAVDATDTVGAGDAFVGGFSAALACGFDDPVRFGQAVAALKCTRPGAQNVPSKKEVEQFLAAH